MEQINLMQFRLTQITLELNSSQASGGCCRRSASTAQTAGFAETLRANLAAIDSQNFDAITALFGQSVGRGRCGSSGIDSLLANCAGVAAPDGGSPVSGLSPTGRNLSLFDPESAYRMMTLINKKEVQYETELGRIGVMADEVSRMQGLGESLAGITADASATDLSDRLQRFVAEYNDWVRQFDADVAPGGILADTQAARASRFELKQNLENPFFGAAEGIHGMRDLGIVVDPATKLASFDSEQFARVYETAAAAVIGTIQEFGRNFARSAELLVSANNFIDNRARNLERVNRYIDENRASLQAEFGLGDPARQA